MIVFFDGECALCNGAVRFLAKRNRGQFFFAPLQGKTAQDKLQKPIRLDTLILWHEGREYHEGKGALRIAWHLGGGWRLLGLFSFLPTFLADAVYRLVAKNRHLFSGSTDDLGEIDQLLE